MTPQPAPPWQTSAWLNTDRPLSLEQLRGRVVLLHAFQMLCPGCVAQALPQAARVVQLFAGTPLRGVDPYTALDGSDTTIIDAADERRQLREGRRAIEP